jgi:hypothetical protein
MKIKFISCGIIAIAMSNGVAASEPTFDDQKYMRCTGIQFRQEHACVDEHVNHMRSMREKVSYPEVENMCHHLNKDVAKHCMSI